MRVLAITTIFPNAVMPRAAPYIRQQCAALSRLCELEVFGTLPWFPGERLLKRFTYWNRDFSKVPRTEVIDGMRVRHPRFLRIPRVGLPFSGAAYAASILPVLAACRPKHDALFATWAYPDGVGAILLGKALRIPTFVQVIGSDVNVIAKQPAPSRQLRLALPHSRGVVAVSRPLADEMKKLGAPRVHVIPTGVDRTVFRPRDRGKARRALKVPGDARLILFVGRLVEAKGIRELLKAFDALVSKDPRYRLVIVGEGPMQAECDAHRVRYGNERVVLAGEVSVDAIPEWLAACDVLALPSYAEGTPNVILEALACGRRVVATRVGGIPDVVRGPAQGYLVAPRDVTALEQAITDVCDEPYDAESVAREAGVFDWNENARRVLGVLQGS